MAVDPGLLDDLLARGLVHDTTDRDRLAARLAEGPITLYAGFDPTADSLHVGNMVGLMLLRRFQEAGHRPIVLAGGATGMIGDPSGKSDERSLLDDDALAANLAGIVPQLRQFLDFERQGNPAKLLDNRAWTVGVPYLVFLRDVGKFITVNQMMAKDSIRSRLDGTEGISYTEFSYMLLQAHDFAWLFENEGCELQTGGSDQWGNITAGTDLIRKRSGGQAHALTHPLLTKPDGTKYGKTAGGETMWLSAAKMSPYRFYQGWLQVEDIEIERLLLQLTLLPVEQIRELVADHEEAPHRREAQRTLAGELTALVHGPEALDAAVAASGVVFGGAAASELDAMTLDSLCREVPTAHLPRSIVDGVVDGQSNVPALLTAAGVVGSNGEATRLIKQNGISINDRKVTVGDRITTDSLLHGRFLFVRRGKRNVHLIRMEENLDEFAG
jgi:tyrosyl-tRNA synthetase